MGRGALREHPAGLEEDGRGRSPTSLQVNQMRPAPRAPSPGTPCVSPGVGCGPHLWVTPAGLQQDGAKAASFTEKPLEGLGSVRGQQPGGRLASLLALPRGKSGGMGEACSPKQADRHAFRVTAEGVEEKDGKHSKQLL